MWNKSLNIHRNSAVDMTSKIVINIWVDYIRVASQDLEIKAAKSLSYEWKHISKLNNAFRMWQNRAAYYFCRIIICCDIDSRGLVVSVDGSGFWIQDKLCIGNVQGYFGRLPTKVISTEKTLLLFLFSMSTINSICLFRFYPRQAYWNSESVSFIYEVWS